jgi:dUTP pyrophosphatase
MDVKIKRVDNTLPLPEYITSGACGFDMYTRETVIIQPLEIALLPSNLVIATPEGYVLQISARSSLARKKGLVMPNGVGIIDQDYSGDNDEILIQVMNVRPEPVTIEKGERIAQGIFVKIERADWQEAASMEGEDRGGFGSSGGYKEKK